ncbi:MAG: LacI family DNA-binding transcriptional regulator [Alphaproteobacteria bacterium]|nr:LacI family DNA-binding transcriptional regulator [Alphaproteobacteria bacterium]
MSRRNESAPIDRPTTGRPTLADVAARAAVSTATVSRCLNSPDLVQAETLDRVMTAVRELGYMPNFGARALAAKRTQTIGAIIPTMENAIFATGIQAFQEALRDAGFTLLIASSQYDAAVEEEQIRSLIARGADGLLLIGYHREEAIYQFLERHGIPCVIAWAYDGSIPRPAIGFDNRGCMAELAAEVLRRGHRRLGMISAETAGNDRARERVAGVRQAMREAGLADDALTVVETRYSFENGRKALDALMSRSPRPTAVICGNDVLAVGAIQAARGLGLKVPEDLSITGFDDIELATVVDPPLTTVHVPHRRMGSRAARLLIDLINGEPAEGAVELHPEIRMRGSLGPAPA